MELEEREEQKLDLLVLMEDFLREARRLWTMALMVMLVCAAVMGIWTGQTYRPVYQATATFTVKVADPMYSSVSLYNTKTAEQMAKTFPYILNSGLLEARVREELGISRLPSVAVSVMPSSSVITLTVRDSDPQRAYDVLNAVIKHYPQIAEYVVGATVLALLDESGVPAAPANVRNVKKAAIQGAVIGLALWILFVLVMAMSKSTIHNEDMLRKRVNFDCFGRVPAVKVPSTEPCPLLHKGRRKPEFSEAIRAIRMRVERTMDAEGKKVLLISSAIPNEGKTTISVNLAMAMARRGKRVVIVDCDLRNPSVAKSLKLQCDRSLVDYLEGRMTVRDVLIPTDTENLFVISGGTGSTTAMDLLPKERGRGMVQAVRTLFDFVILDTPPCSLLADAGEVATLADAGMLVVRQDYASQDQILDGVQRLGDADLPMIGWVFNRAEKTISSGQGYGYGDADSYGYGFGKK